MVEKYKVDDLKTKSEDELKSLLLDLKREQINQRFEAATGQLNNTGSMKTVRRTIARIKTLLNEKSADIHSSVKKS